MIKFKKLINKRNSESERIKLYNSIINENLDNIINIFRLSHLRISTHNEQDGSITLLIDDGYEGNWFDDSRQDLEDIYKDSKPKLIWLN